MNPPAWLAELHRQWVAARGRRVDSPSRAFKRDWEQLLDDAGINRAEDRQAAVREAEKLPQLKLHRLAGRPYIVKKVELPLDAEAWLHRLFGTESGGALQQQSGEVIDRWAATPHPLQPELWANLCARIQEAFAGAHSIGPFSWRDPDSTGRLLRLLFQLTSREWPEGTLIRDASAALGYETKELEKQMAPLARALERMFGREMPLESLGIQTSSSVLLFSGPLTLHFPDGSCHQTQTLRFESTLPVAELERAVSITTTAERLLTVENRKTTFVQLARADAARTTLMVATSFPTQAVRLLLQKLGTELPHFHFGDTDPAGWDILRQLRAISSQEVRPLLMEWRPTVTSRPLTQRERQTLDRLLGDAEMADCGEPLTAMRNANQRGDFEQESLGAPDLRAWPFYSRA